MANTLLLNQGYQPLATISWQKAVCLLTLGKVEVIEEYDQKELRSRTWVIKMPAVVRLVKSIRRHKKHVKFSRSNVYARDRWKCQYCGEKHKTDELNLDHVVPKSKGGKTCWSNIVTSCIDCNTKKRDLALSEAQMKLIKKPIRPDWVPIFSIRFKGTVPDKWASYIYWNTELG